MGHTTATGQQASAVGDFLLTVIGLVFFGIIAIGCIKACEGVKNFIGGNKWEGYRVMSYDGVSKEWTLERTQNIHRSGEFFGHTIKQRLVITCKGARWRWEDKLSDPGNTEGWIPTYCDVGVSNGIPLQQAEEQGADQLVIRERKKAANGNLFDVEENFTVVKNEMVSQE